MWDRLFNVPLEVDTGAVLALHTQPQVQKCQVWRVNVKIGKDCQRELRNKVWNFGRGNIHIGTMMFVIKNESHEDIQDGRHVEKVKMYINARVIPWDHSQMS